MSMWLCLWRNARRSWKRHRPWNQMGGYSWRFCLPGLWPRQRCVWGRIVESASGYAVILLAPYPLVFLDRWYRKQSSLIFYVLNLILFFTACPNRIKAFFRKLLMMLLPFCGKPCIIFLCIFIAERQYYETANRFWQRKIYCDAI